MSDLRNLLDLCQAQAILNKLSPNEVSVWHSYCREYSQKFFTPLADVLVMDMEHVISQVHEARLDDIDVDERLEQIVEITRQLVDPSYNSKRRRDDEEFVKQIVKPKTKAKAKPKAVVEKALPAAEAVKTQEKPPGGFIDLGYLSREASKDAGNGEF